MIYKLNKNLYVARADGIYWVAPEFCKNIQSFYFKSYYFETEMDLIERGAERIK